MVKAVRVLGEQMSSSDEASESDGDKEFDDDVTATDAEGDTDNQLDFDTLDAPFKRMGCMAHTLQLIC
jgi:hypothetical protein